jgi:hypothetical protein
MTFGLSFCEPNPDGLMRMTSKTLIRGNQNRPENHYFDKFIPTERLRFTSTSCQRFFQIKVIVGKLFYI